MAVLAVAGQRLADLPILLATQAATRQTTPTAMVTPPRRERCALAREAGEVIVPSTLGSDLAGSVKYMMAATIARMAMITRTATAAVLPADPPRAWLAVVTSSSLTASMCLER